MSHENDDRTTNFLRQLSFFESQEAIYKEELADALLAFNRIENFVSDMIYQILSQAKRDDLHGKAINKQFMARVEALEFLLVSVPNAPKVPYARLKKLADERNAFAHGHFSADANTGEVVVLGKGRATPWKPEKVLPFLEECSAVRRELSGIYAHILFGDKPVALPPGASAKPL
jgi:uncharacterized protein with HEPN domain